MSSIQNHHFAIKNESNQKQQEQWQQQQEQWQQHQQQENERYLKNNAFDRLSNPNRGFSYTNEFKNTEEGLKFKDGGNYTLGEMLSNGVAKMDEILNQVTGGHGSVANYEDINKAMCSSGYNADFAKIMDVNNDQSITGDELLAFSIYQDAKASELKDSRFDHSVFDGQVSGDEIHTSKIFIKNNQDIAKAEIAQLHQSLNLSA